MSRIVPLQRHFNFCKHNNNNNNIGSWNGLAIKLIQEIGRRTTAINEDARETVQSWQSLSMVLQQGNALAFQNTMSTE